MPPVLLMLLLGAVRWTASYTIHKESLSRVYRGPYEEWKPVSDSATSYQRTRLTVPSSRYPVHYKGFALGPHKKPLQQSAEHSQNVQVFSPAPPTILGSFSVFGHATVNAREPASLAKKPPKQTSVDYSSLDTAQSKYQHTSSADYSSTDQVKRPQRFNGYDQTYFYDDSRRSPNRDGAYKSTHVQSTSLNPNTYYYESQPFHASNVDHSYHKARKPQKHHLSQVPFRGIDSGFVVTTEDYRTSVDPYNSGTFYDGLYKNQKNPPQPTPYYDRQPFGDISIGTHQTHKGHAKDIYNQYSHLSRPFQNTQAFNPLEPLNNAPTYPPFVTTYSAPNIDSTRVKFSEVAHPFQVENKYQHQSSHTPRPSYIVTQQPYAEEIYPFSVTTLGVPSNTVHQRPLSSFIPSARPQTTIPDDKYTRFASQRPSPGVSNYQNQKGYSPSFLPTPSSGDHSLVIEPTSDAQATLPPQVASTVENKDQELSTGDSTTWNPPETTTTTTSVKPTSNLKARRRPTRPSQGHRDKDDTRLKNNKIDDEVRTTTDSQKHQRRRKPGSKYRESSEYKRTRTSTTSTTEAPTQAPEEHVEEHLSETTDPVIYGDMYKDINDDFVHKAKPDSYDGYQQAYSHPEKYPTQNIPDNELYTNSKDNHYQYAPSTTAEPATTPYLPPTTPRRASLSQSSTVQPVSVTPPSVETTSNAVNSRLKNKYGNNRPRFSVKDYRERLNKATSTSSPQANADIEQPKTKNEYSRVRNRGYEKSTSQATISSDDSTTEATSRPRKFKPKFNPSRNFYKTSTTQRPDVLDSTTTTERPNTFRPSTNRYKPGTGKYYSRYKTSSLPPKEVDDSPVTTTARIVIKPKGVFSAKRRPPAAKKTQEAQPDNENVSEEMVDPTPHFGDTLKTHDNEVTKNGFNKKMDDIVTTLMTSEEIKREQPQANSNTPEASATTSSSTTESSTEADPPTEQKVATVADLTSSSSNDYQSASVFRRVYSSRRPPNKIVIPSEEPILPLEAFFQAKYN